MSVGFRIVPRWSRFNVRGTVFSTSTASSSEMVFSSTEALATAMKDALNDGGTDELSTLLAAASLERNSPGKSHIKVAALDGMSCNSWVEAVRSASGLASTVPDSQSAGRASSCFNVLLSELGRARDDSAGPSRFGGHRSVPAERGAKAAAVLAAMRNPKTGCQPDVVAFSAAACACFAAGDAAKAEEILALGAAATGRRPGEKRVRLRKAAHKASGGHAVGSGPEVLDAGLQVRRATRDCSPKESFPPHFSSPEE